MYLVHVVMQKMWVGTFFSFRLDHKTRSQISVDVVLGLETSWILTEATKPIGL